MQKITITVEGMKCAMCAKRINEGIEKVCKVKSVESSPETKQTVVVAKEADIDALKKAIESLGFGVTDVKTEEITDKKSIFGFMKK